MLHEDPEIAEIAQGSVDRMGVELIPQWSDVLQVERGHGGSW
jgi:hypothetical protein